MNEWIHAPEYAATWSEMHLNIIINSTDATPSIWSTKKKISNRNCSKPHWINHSQLHVISEPRPQQNHKAEPIFALVTLSKTTQKLVRMRLWQTHFATAGIYVRCTFTSDVDWRLADGMLNIVIVLLCMRACSCLCARVGDARTRVLVADLCVIVCVECWI